MASTVRAAIYARHLQLGGAEAQVETARTLAATDGVDPDTARVFLDLGPAGKRTARPEHAGLVSAIEAGEIDAVYVASLTRLARSMTDLNRFVAICAAHGTSIVSSDGPRYDPGTPEGTAFHDGLQTVAEMEHELAVERQRGY